MQPAVALRAGCIGLALVLAGCSTPGALHVYSVGAYARHVNDTAPLGDDSTARTPTHLYVGDEITGFAYDSFTDHFFLRLNPGNRIRVVDRPARKIKREFTVAAPTTRGGDLAVRPRDGHLFLVDPAAPDLIETSRLGEFIGRVRMQGRTAPARAVAYDASVDEVLVLDGDDRTVERYTPAGKRVGGVKLNEPVGPCLGFDPERGELYAPLQGRTDVGVFDRKGRRMRTLPLSPTDEWLDVGPHSLLRLF